MTFPESRGYLVAYTAPRAESHVRRGIEEAGHEAVLLMEKLRQKVERKNLWRVIDRPLFSRYVFFRPLSLSWGNVLGVEGVNDVLRNNDVPSRIPPAFVDALRKAESYGLFDRTKGSPNPFEIGETVRLSSGPFSGHNAVIESFVAKLKSSTAKKRVNVLLDFMGRQARFDIDVCDLEKL